MWRQLFFFFSIFSGLISDITEDNCRDNENAIMVFQMESDRQIHEYYKIDPNNLEKRLEALKKIVQYCDHVISSCYQVLEANCKDLFFLERKGIFGYGGELKEILKNGIQKISERRDSLQNGGKIIEAQIASNKIYERSLEKVIEAKRKNLACQRRLNNIAEVVDVLNSVANLYEEAKSVTKEAIELLNRHRDAIPEYLRQFNEIINNYQDEANKYRKEAADWPTNVIVQRATLKEKFNLHKEEVALFQKKGLHRSAYELEKQIVILLEQLIDGATAEESEALEAEKKQLKSSIEEFEKKADNDRLTKVASSLSKETFKEREEKRKELFFKSDFLSNI